MMKIIRLVGFSGYRPDQTKPRTSFSNMGIGWQLKNTGLYSMSRGKEHSRGELRQCALAEKVSCISFCTTILNISLFAFSDVDFLILQRTLRAGKLTERILKLFVATGKEEILSMIRALNIQLVLTPVLPTSKSYSTDPICILMRVACPKYYNFFMSGCSEKF
ncbi:hypothetical protein OSB04_016904 [Centaurea solstitialis]|uniref:Uncharacterized protein n=1 Tax=Centaurea solstitialis TaxID=347529 RepID=A0AA38WK73_9ASTR|nr:hypothetical protein OSB04_016904 [Centaurea solstitialis]